jgi:plastocyanin
MKKLAVLISVLALAAFGFAACGDDDDDDTAADTTTEETTAGGGGGTLEVSSSEDITYDQSSLEASAGAVTIDFTNDSGIPHDVVIEDADGNEVAATDEITSGSTSANADLEAGDYTFYCSVDGHREAGMEGPLTVQ